MVFSWLNLFQLLTLVLSALLGVYVLSLGRPRALAAYLLLLALHNGIRLAVVQGASILDVTHAFRVIYGVLMFFTTRELLFVDRPYRMRDLLHALLPVLVAILPLMTSLTRVQLGPLTVVVLVAYLAASFQLLVRWQHGAQANRAAPEPDTVRWLRWLLYCYSGLLVFEVSRFTLGLVVPEALRHVLHAIFVVASSVALMMLVFVGLRRTSLLPGLDAEEEGLAETLRRPRQPAAQHMALRGRLLECMQHDKPYLDPQLNLRQLSERLGVPARQLSELVNDEFACNFSEFINRARVEEAQRQLLLDPHRSLLDIALDSGFNSKTSFNVMFKRLAGVTPSQFRQQQATHSATRS